MPVLDIVVAALAMVLVVSGVLKVREPAATAPMLRAIGLPDAPAVVYAVAAAEIVVGATTLVIGGAGPTVVLALLYAAFAVVGILVLRADEAVPCGCFGQQSAEMTPLHVGVNAAAAVLAGAGALLGTTTLLSADDGRSTGVIALALAAAVLLAAVVVALLTVVPARLGGTPAAPPPALALEPDSPGAGTGVTTLHEIAGLTLTGDAVTVPVAGTGTVTLLAFLTTGCTTCLHFWDTFSAAGGVDLPGAGTDLVVVTRGDDQENPARVRDLAPADHRVVRSSEAWRAYGVTAGPYFVLVDGDRDLVLGEGTATAWADVVGLVRQAV